ncbi:MAG: DNA integrity scanning protein DisA nucleotide-binding domain protein [Methanosarcinales archaeon]|nr:DNA integrity scanning protein DisA nucleotide-binding domain protein [Methanosarcinales archaeon]
MVDIDQIIQTAADMAEDISASAIIIMSTDLPQELDTDIPVLITSPSIFSTLYVVDADLYEENDSAKRLQAFTKTIYHKASKGSEQIIDASSKAFISNLIEDGLIVGIVSLQGNIAIVIHDLNDNSVIQELKACSERINLNVLKSVLNIALDIGSLGREGKSVGTAFIISDTEEVMRRSHQLVLNPFFGHAKEECSILEPLNWETVKEFAQLDGMFVIDSDGYIQASGRYLDVDAREVDIIKGLGGRHASAAAITRDTEAVAITVSESGGMIRIYKDGLQIIELDPRTSKVFRHK